MKKITKYLLLIIPIGLIVTSCKYSCKENDQVSFSAKFIKNEKKIEMKLENSTPEDFLVIIPRAIGLKNQAIVVDPETGSKIIEAYLTTNLKKTKYSMEMDTIYDKVDQKNGFSNDSSKQTFLDAVLIKKNEKILLNYKVDSDLIPNQIYKWRLFKMRDVLNVPYNIDIIRQLLEYRKSDGIKIYLDDFNVKDSLIIKS